MNQQNNDDIKIGTNNVFSDLGYPDAVERQMKTRLAMAINDMLRDRKLKKREIAELLHIPQAQVSELKNYRLDQFSKGRLLEFLTCVVGVR